MNVSDEVFYDWLDKLTERLEFTEHELGKWQWHCGLKDDRLGKAKLAAGDAGASYEDLMARIAGHACCDCEIIFNYDDRSGQG